MKRDLRIIGALSALILFPSLGFGGESPIKIGTGGSSGNFFPVGQALCQTLSEAGIPCEALATDGSVDNLTKIRAGDLQFALVQADTQYLAYKGGERREGLEINKRLRAVFSLYDEPYTLVVKRGSGIEKFTDIRGKRINLGMPKSGERETNHKLMDRIGWRESDFAKVTEESYRGQHDLFCAGQIDAMPVIIGHPNPSVADVLSRCEGEIIPVVNLSVHTLVQEYPYFTASMIHAGTYPEVTENIPTFAVKSTFVTSSDTPTDLVYAVTKAIFSNLEKFRMSHPALKWIESEEMLKGNSAPFHRGAERYYWEAGLLAR